MVSGHGELLLTLTQHLLLFLWWSSGQHGGRQRLLSLNMNSRLRGETQGIKSQSVSYFSVMWWAEKVSRSGLTTTKKKCASLPAAWGLVAGRACAAGDCGLLRHICTEGLHAQGRWLLRWLVGGPWSGLLQEEPTGRQT